MTTSAGASRIDDGASRCAQPVGDRRGVVRIHLAAERRDGDPGRRRAQPSWQRPRDPAAAHDELVAVEHGRLPGVDRGPATGEAHARTIVVEPGQPRRPPAGGDGGCARRAACRSRAARRRSTTCPRVTRPSAPMLAASHTVTVPSPASMARTYRRGPPPSPRPRRWPTVKRWTPSWVPISRPASSTTAPGRNRVRAGGALDEPRRVAGGHEAHLHALGLVGHRQAEGACLGPHLLLGEVADREERPRQRGLIEPEQEVRLILGAVLRRPQGGAAGRRVARDARVVAGREVARTQLAGAPPEQVELHVLVAAARTGSACGPPGTRRRTGARRRARRRRGSRTRSAGSRADRRRRARRGSRRASSSSRRRRGPGAARCRSRRGRPRRSGPRRPHCRRRRSWPRPPSCRRLRAPARTSRGSRSMTRVDLVGRRVGSEAEAEPAARRPRSSRPMARSTCDGSGASGGARRAERRRDAGEVEQHEQALAGASREAAR